MNMKSRLRAGEWFGCGKVITTESWNAFVAAYKEYYANLDKASCQKCGEKITGNVNKTVEGKYLCGLCFEDVVSK